MRYDVYCDIESKLCNIKFHDSYTPAELLLDKSLLADMAYVIEHTRAELLDYARIWVEEEKVSPHIDHRCRMLRGLQFIGH